MLCRLARVVLLATFVLAGRTVTLDGGQLTVADGTVAGAHLGMSEAVRNAVRLIGVPLDEALEMACGTPARLLGLSDVRGRVRAGYKADLTAFSPEFVCLQTWIGGLPDDAPA